jgi:transketolase
MPMSEPDIAALRQLARRIRLHVLRMTNRGGSSHVGAAFSMADIVAVLYGSILRINPANAQDPARDRFLLSKGHAGAAIYAALAERGFFPAERLLDHCQDGADFSGHISHKGIPGVEYSTGSLGHALPVAAGMAFAAKRAGANHRVFCVMSDGECDEGSNWEAILFAPHHKLDNLVAIVDYNKIQSLGPVPETLTLEPFADKWRAFGWEVREVDGHDYGALHRNLAATPWSVGKPSVLLCHTTKGKGVSYMENTVMWHYRTAKGADFDKALSELEAADQG